MPIGLIIRAVKRVKTRLREDGDPEDVRLPYLIVRKLGRFVGCCCAFCSKKDPTDETSSPPAAAR
jgi:hypothetical protein